MISTWEHAYYAQLPTTIIDSIGGLIGSFLIFNILIKNNQEIS